MILETARKFVQVINIDAWHVALGEALERFQGTESWGLQGRVVDKATAEKFFERGMIQLHSDDIDVTTNLRFRYRQAFLLPAELPEKCGPEDSILLVRKREVGEAVQPGYDNRYHLFLVTWAEPSQLNTEFGSEAPAKLKGKTKKGELRTMCLHKKSRPSDRASVKSGSSKKRGYRKGLTGSGQPHRWRF